MFGSENDSLSKISHYQNSSLTGLNSRHQHQNPPRTLKSLCNN
jgi:hypothetical protein